MRKRLLLIFSVFLMSTCVFAKKAIPFTVTWGHETDLGNGHPKSPMRPPAVYIEDYTLLFVEGHPDYFLNIKDEDGDTVYSTTVYESITQVLLPSTLSGNYEIELVMGSWVFTGSITL